MEDEVIEEPADIVEEPQTSEVEESNETEQEPEQAATWVKELRKNYRELAKENKDLKSKIAPAADPEIQLGQKPTLEGCQYDESEYDSRLEEWHSKKFELAQVEKRKKEQEQQAAEEWQQTLKGYEKSKTTLKVEDFEESEEVVTDFLSTVQQGIIISGCANSAAVVYEIGKDPAIAKKFADIKDPVKFAFAIAKLESSMSSKSRSAPAPEKRISGNASTSSIIDSTLNRLRSEADKTGDYTKVHEYRMQKRNK